MSIFNRTRYLRTLFIILPFGLLAMFYGIKAQFDLPKEEELIKKSGIVLRTGVKKEYSDIYETVVNTEQLFLENHSNYYNFNRKKDYELFKKSFNKGEKVTIWLNPKSELKTIRQFSKNGKVLLRYHRIDIAHLILAGFGFIAIIISLIYAFKHPEDFWGGDKDRMNKDMNPWSKYKR